MMMPPRIPVSLSGGLRDRVLEVCKAGAIASQCGLASFVLPQGHVLNLRRDHGATCATFVREVWEGAKGLEPGSWEHGVPQIGASLARAGVEVAACDAAPGDVVCIRFREQVSGKTSWGDASWRIPTGGHVGILAPFSYEGWRWFYGLHGDTVQAIGLEPYLQANPGDVRYYWPG